MNVKQNIMIILVISISLSTGIAYAEIPSWVKEVAGFWAAGQIDDDEYARTIEYLVTEEIISVPIPTANTPTDPTYVIDSAHPCADLEIWSIKASSEIGLNYINQHIESLEPNSIVINYYNKVIKGINDSVQTNTEKCTRADYPEHWKRYDHAVNAFDKYWKERKIPTTTPSSTPTTTPSSTPTTTPSSTPTTTPSNTFNPNLIDTEIISCERSTPTSDYIKMKSKFRNLDTSQEYKVEYIMYVTDSNNEIITYHTRYINLEPGLQKLEEKLLEYSGSWTGCGIEIKDMR